MCARINKSWKLECSHGPFYPYRYPNSISECTEGHSVSLTNMVYSEQVVQFFSDIIFYLTCHVLWNKGP